MACANALLTPSTAARSAALARATDFADPKAWSKAFLRIGPMPGISSRGLAPIILERPKVSQPPIRWLTLDEANRLIAACGEHLRPLVIFMLYSGARIGEALEGGQ